MPSEHNSHFLPDNFFGRVSKQTASIMRPSIYPIHWIPLLLALGLLGFLHFSNKAIAQELVSSLNQQQQISWQLYLQSSKAQDEFSTRQFASSENTDIPAEFRSGLAKESLSLTGFSFECFASKELKQGFLASQSNPVCMLNRDSKQP